MNFGQRFLRYLVGFAIGTMIVFFMFPQYDWLSWTPKKRVMTTIREAQFTIAPQAQCELDCIGAGIETVQLMRNDGTVDFENSDVKQDPKIYHLQYGNMSFKLSLTDTTAVLINATKDGVTCNCRE